MLMATWDGTRIKRALTQKGFHKDEPTDHEYFRFYFGNKATSVRTKVSFGSKGKTEVSSSSPLFSAFQNQLHLTNRELRDFFNCPMSVEQYTQLLKDKGVISESTDENQKKKAIPQPQVSKVQSAKKKAGRR